jgi:hypothetical protein
MLEQGGYSESFPRGKDEDPRSEMASRIFTKRTTAIVSGALSTFFYARVYRANNRSDMQVSVPKKILIHFTLKVSSKDLVIGKNQLNVASVNSYKGIDPFFPVKFWGSACLYPYR